MQPDRALTLVLPTLEPLQRASTGANAIAMLAQAINTTAGNWTAADVARKVGLAHRGEFSAQDVAAGLNAARIAWRRGSGASVNDLRQTLQSWNFALIDCSDDGRQKWRIVVKAIGSVFYVQSAEGVERWSAEQLYDEWSTRLFEHFVIPASRLAHQLFIPEPHQRTLLQFTRGGRVLRQSEVPGSSLAAIQRAHEFAATAIPDAIQKLPFTYNGWGFYRSFKGAPSNMVNLLAEHESSPGKIQGVIYRGVPYIHPGMRGRRGGAALILAGESDQPNVYLRPTSFSEAGYAARVRAHAIAVMKARIDGLPVRRAVIDSNPLLRGRALDVPYVQPTIAVPSSGTPTPPRGDPDPNHVAWLRAFEGGADAEPSPPEPTTLALKGW